MVVTKQTYFSPIFLESLVHIHHIAGVLGGPQSYQRWYDIGKEKGIFSQARQLFR